jgi:hypothetical protein
MVKINPLSWLSAAMRGPLPDDAVPGTIWQFSPLREDENNGQHNNNDSSSSSANKSNGNSPNHDNDIRSSHETGDRRRVCFRNRTDETLLLCFVDEKGQPHHFHPLEPYQGGGRHHKLLRGGDVIITADDHVESTWEGHAFLFARADDVLAVRRDKSLSNGGGARIIGGYRAEAGRGRRLNQDDDDDKQQQQVELVEVYCSNANSGCCVSSLRNLLSCCRPSKRKLKDEDDEDDEEAASATKAAPLLSSTTNMEYKIRVRIGIIDPTPLDTTTKQYDPTTLGETAQWPVRVEPGSLTHDVAVAIAADLDEMTRCLPPHAVAALRTNTPIWINQSLRYGPRACPITARGMCFHPGANWLNDMGMCVEKCEAVELYKAAEYTSDRPLWGVGGLLIHEFSHAYHHKCCEDGYDNALIKHCYEQAMAEGLYDCVPVHGPQGPTARAYACTDPMEYFAELSTAFLGGSVERIRARGEEDVEHCEFNKWYPFNRQQIQTHDPRAFEMLKKIWKVET